MKNKVSFIPDNIYELNETERFLKDFLQEYPAYRFDLVGNGENSDREYHQLLSVMQQRWNQKKKGTPFFLKDAVYQLKEDFFLLSGENVTMRRNLRYLPLIMHSHQFIEVNYVLSSSGSSMITADGRQALHDGDVILCTPNFSHCFDAMQDDSIILDFFIRVSTFETVFFRLLNCSNYLSTAFANAIYHTEGNYILWHCQDNVHLRDLTLSSYQEYLSKAKYSEQMLEANITKFFVLLMRYYENGAFFSIPQVNTTDSLFQSLHNYMMLHCQNVTLTTMAAQFGYSERQLIRILKKNSGKGFSELLQDIRMNKAIGLLKNQSITVPQIAKMLGYSSVSYFQKVFLRTFTFTPEAFRERMKKLS